MVFAASICTCDCAYFNLQVFLSYGENPKATVQDEKENAVPLKAS